MVGADVCGPSVVTVNLMVKISGVDFSATLALTGLTRLS